VARRGIRRFVLEVLFLAGVAAALTVADLRPAAVIVLMVLAWVVVALLEWTAWLDEPHYGRGLPPRYYVPHVALPPPRPVEQHHHGRYPGDGYPVFVHDDEPTFVASTTEWSAALDEWPMMDTGAAEDTVIAVPDEVERSVVLPPPIPELEETVAAGPAVPEVLAAAAAAEAIVAPEVERRRTEPAKPREKPVELVPLVLEPRAQTTIVHHVDPLAPTGRRRFWRRSADEDAVEVLDGPAPDRVLPIRLQGGNGADAE
jgi:hypothetical protein